MAISDPSGILRRVPELHELTKDERIRHAIESGDPFRVYRALMFARIWDRLYKKAKLLKSLTRQRKLFARPLKKTPSLGTINSFGLRFVGEFERDEDGYYITMHAFVIFYVIPLIPLGAYVVERTADDGWRIFARAPLGIPGWLYTRGLSLGLVLAIIGGSFANVKYVSKQEILITNGFDRPLSVQLGAEKMTIPASGQSSVILPLGEIRGRAELAGYGEVDVLQTKLESQSGYTIWNVAGATPLIKEQVAYTRDRSQQPKDADYSIYCGQHFLHLAKADYNFVEPPQSKSVRRGGGVEWSSWLHVGHARQGPDFGVCINYLMEQKKTSQAAQLLAVYAWQQDWPRDLTGTAAYLLARENRQHALDLMRKAARDKPSDLSLQIGFQDIADMTGNHDETRKLYQTRAVQNPDSEQDQYLHLRLQYGAEGLSGVRAALKRWPNSPQLQMSLAYRLLLQGQEQAALEAYQRAWQIEREAVLARSYSYATALVANGQRKQAWQMMREQTGSGKGDPHMAYQMAQLALGYGYWAQERFDAEFLQLKDQETVDNVRALAGMETLGKGNNALIKMAKALRAGNNEDALLQIRDMNAAQIEQLPEAYLVVLMGLAQQHQDMPSLNKLRKSPQLAQQTAAPLLAYMKGEDLNLQDYPIGNEGMVAAALIRSRSHKLKPNTRAEMRTFVNQRDYFKGILSTLNQQWPE